MYIGIPDPNDDSADYFAEGVAATIATNALVLFNPCAVPNNFVLTIFVDPPVSTSQKFTLHKTFISRIDQRSQCI